MLAPIHWPFWDLRVAPNGVSVAYRDSAGNLVQLTDNATCVAQLTRWLDRIPGTVPSPYLSRGIGTLTGTVPVSVAFPDITDDNFVSITRTSTSGGGDTGHIVVEKTVGVGFTVRSTRANDTGTFSYLIE